MKTNTTLLAVFAVLLLAGCSGPPSESKGRAALEQKIQRESNGLIRLTSFKKADGVAQDAMGMKMYQLKYTAEIEFTDNCYWGNGGGLLGWGGSFFADRPDPMLGNVGHYKGGAKGQRESVSATLVFQKTENGWSLTN